NIDTRPARVLVEERAVIGRRCELRRLRGIHRAWIRRGEKGVIEAAGVRFERRVQQFRCATPNAEGLMHQAHLVGWGPRRLQRKAGAERGGVRGTELAPRGRGRGGEGVKGSSRVGATTHCQAVAPGGHEPCELRFWTYEVEDTVGTKVVQVVHERLACQHVI